MSVFDLLDGALPSLGECRVVVVTSKVVALCENAVVPIEGTDRTRLVRDEAELYPDAGADEGHEYGFTIRGDTLIPASGIDVSNGNGSYVLWPPDPMASAQAMRDHLRARHGVDEVGVIITDSAIGLSRWGTLGIAIGHSGFEPIRNYVGTPDLFGRPLKLSAANVAGGLAAAAVLVMGEGAEGTPVAVIEDVGSVTFWKGDAIGDEGGVYYVSPLDDRAVPGLLRERPVEARRKAQGVAGAAKTLAAPARSVL